MFDIVEASSLNKHFCIFHFFLDFRMTFADGLDLLQVFSPTDIFTLTTTASLNHILVLFLSVNHLR